MFPVAATAAVAVTLETCQDRACDHMDQLQLLEGQRENTSQFKAPLPCETDILNLTQRSAQGNPRHASQIDKTEHDRHRVC